MDDFESAETDNLTFRKNEILDGAKQEDTGWWAAMRRDNIVAAEEEGKIQTGLPGASSRDLLQS
ncbi:hypothetical protein B0H10DRAFT_1298155 [Mycena sp. CBHHK59/15]|nr:hypothetical protein B0H10DRAFT_1298155 [Mycena sp. CBHHK59/15]